MSLVPVVVVQVVARGLVLPLETGTVLVSCVSSLLPCETERFLLRLPREITYCVPLETSSRALLRVPLEISGVLLEIARVASV